MLPSPHLVFSSLSFQVLIFWNKKTSIVVHWLNLTGVLQSNKGYAYHFKLKSLVKINKSIKKWRKCTIHSVKTLYSDELYLAFLCSIVLVAASHLFCDSVTSLIRDKTWACRLLISDDWNKKKTCCLSKTIHISKFPQKVNFLLKT